MSISCLFKKKNTDAVKRNGEAAESRTIVRYVTQTGANGVDGADAYQVILSPNVHVFQGGPTAAEDGQTDKVNVFVFRGSTQINGRILGGEITGQENGLTVTVDTSSNGTIGAFFTVNVDSNLTSDSGTLTIPIEYNMTVLDASTAYDASLWDDSSNYNYGRFEAIYSWSVAKSSTSAYILDLSNENASINADASGNIITGAMRPSCKATLTHGSSDVSTGVYYSISYPSNYGVQGVSINNSTGVMTFNAGTASTPFRFGDVNDPNDTVLEITVDASYNGGEHKQKVMTITKMLPGQSGLPGDPGEDAVSRWIDLSADAIRVDASNNAIPSTITAKAYKQIGGNNPTEDSSATIKWKYDSSVTSDGSIYVSPITVDASKNYMTFGLYHGSTFLGETEEVPILRDGKNGEPGAAGPKGAVIRGPIEWKSELSRRFCNGEYNSSYPQDASYIDVVVKDSSYYVCTTSYTQSAGTSWSSVYPSNWTLADGQYDFIATKLLLAHNAKIDFLSGNEIYLTDASGNISGGARAADSSSDVIFWAGSTNNGISNAPFQVDYQGNIIAKSGTFSGYLQMPYVLIDDLDHNDGTNYVEYIADSRAYIIAYPLAYTSTYQRRLVLPTPSASLNGFMYDIIVYPMLTRMDGAPDVLLKTSDNSTIYCVAYAELRMSDKFNLTYGRYTITCVPWSYKGTYKWFITSATGGIENIISASSSEYVSTLLATSSDSNKLIYKVQTYTGNSHPSVNNPNQTLFVKPQ